jgi:hypothetical protein
MKTIYCVLYSRTTVHAKIFEHIGILLKTFYMWDIYNEKEFSLYKFECGTLKMKKYSV